MVEQKPQPQVVLFSTPTCSWCRKTKQYLSEHRIRYKEVDVSRDQQAAADLVRRTNQMGVPVVLINNKPIIGFNKTEIDRLLNIK
ncbi:MAG: glutaredoxin family protein [Deltaproteobacteria bacterium]|nr:glutaredoxin family protein [Deltaproteobacteria bacterium]